MSKEILNRFGYAVRRIRHDRHISQEQLADMCGLHRTYISDVELGKRNVSLENVEKVALALDITITELFTEVEKES